MANPQTEKSCIQVDLVSLPSLSAYRSLCLSLSLSSSVNANTMYNNLRVILTACLLSASAFTTRIHKSRDSLVSRRIGEDDEIDPDSLGDWRAFRRSLAGLTTTVAGCIENERVLRTQNEALADEYRTGVWAHETSTVRCSSLL